MARRSKVVVGVFETSDAARQAVDDLVKAGFKKENIGVVSRNGKLKKGKAATDSKWEEGAVAGAATGAGVGALWALGIAAGALPAIGPVIAGGLLASVLASAAGGAAVAGLVGALIGLGIPEEDARYYESEFKQGRTIVTVRANGRAAEASEIITRHGGYDRESAPQREGRAKRTAATARAADGERVIPVRREEARVKKTPVKKGEVEVRKEVVTDQKTVTVPVEREEVVVERRPARRRAAAGVTPGKEEVRIPVTEEDVRVEKETVVDEEVVVGKRKERGSKTVSAPVRREKVTVEERGQTRDACRR